MHRPKFTDKIQWNEDTAQFERIVTASWKDKSITVYRESQEGQIYWRHLYFNIYSGYLVFFPGEEVTIYYNKYLCESESEWEELDKKLGITSNDADEKDLNSIYELYPYFRYTIKKYIANNDNYLPSNAAVIELLYFWLKDPNIELLIAAGCFNLAFSKQFYKLSESKRREVIAWIKKNPGKDVKLQKIFFCIKYNIDIEEVEKYKYWQEYVGIKCNYNDYLYLKNRQIDEMVHWRDYLKMLKEEKPNKLKEAYWRYPKDIYKAHDKIVREIKARKKAEQEDFIKQINSRYQPIIKKYLNSAGKIRSYDIFIPSSYEEIIEQAEALNQCLISCNYTQQVIDQKCLLVFIRSKGKPIATAELKPGNKLGQFYANELDRINCRPSKAVQKAFNEWFCTFKGFKPKKSRKRNAA